MEDLSGAPAPGTPRPRTQGARRRPATPTPLSTRSKRHKESAFPVLSSVLPAPRRPVTAAQAPTVYTAAKTPSTRGGASVEERRNASNTVEDHHSSLRERLHASGLKRSVVQAQLFPAVRGKNNSRLSEGLVPRKRHEGESYSNNQSADERSLRYKPLVSSLNVNPTGAVLIPSRPTSSAATSASTQRKRLLTSAGAKTAREYSANERVLPEREPMSARDRYYVDQRATTAPGGMKHRHHLRPPVISGEGIGGNGYAEETIKTPETLEAGIGAENSHQRHREELKGNDTPRRGDLFARRHEVKTLAEKLVDGFTQRADSTSADGGFGLTTPSGAVPRDSFFYMRRVGSNPYNLEVTTHSRIDPKDYFTVSRLGVTHFAPDGVEFLPLQRFERENYIYSLLTKLPFFKKYRIWKRFTIWKRAVSARKRVDAFVSLNNSLFILLPHLHDALLQVRNACLDLQEARLFNFDHPMGPGEDSTWTVDANDEQQQQPQKTYTLADFSLRLKAQKIRVERLVDHFISDSEMTAKHACEKYLYSFLQSTGFNDSKLTGCSGDTRRRSSVIMSRRKESKVSRDADSCADQKPMTYTERATMRTQCRRITKFLRVVEFLVSDALLRMAISSTVFLQQSLVTFIRGVTDDGDLSGGESPPNKATLSSPPDSTSQQPLIRVEVALKSDTTSQLKPSSRPRGMRMSTVSAVAPNSPPTTAIREHQVASEAGNPMDMLEFTPSTETLRLQLETLVFNGLSAVTNRERLLRNSMFKVYVEASLDDGAQGGDGDDDGGELSSENMDLDILIMEDVTFVETLQSINSIVLDAYELAEENCGELSVFLERYQENTRFRKDVSDPSRYLDTDVHDFRELLDKYIQEAQDVDTVAETASCGLLLLDRTELNSLLKPSPRKCLDGLYKLIPVVFRLLNDNLTKELTTTNDRISTIPTTVEEFSESLAFLRELQAGHDEIEERYRCVRSLYHLLEEYRVKMTDTDQMNAFVLTQKKSQLKASIELFEACCEQYSAKFGIELEARLPGLVSKLTTVSNALSNSPLFDLKSDINDIIGYLTRVEADTIQLETEVKLHFQYEKTLGLPQSTAFEELDDLKADLALKIDMWKTFQEWRGVVSVWEKQRFPEEIDFTTIVDRVEHFYNQITQWEQRLSEGMGPLCMHLKSCVEEYRVTMPILTDLRCPSFEERHYNQLRELLGFGIRHLGSSRTSMNAPVLTLGELVQMHLSPFGSQINRIATEAAQERLLKDMLSKIIVLWERLEFDVKPHKESKEYYVLASLEAIYTTLEESLVSMATVLSSKFLVPIKDLALMWHKRLLLFQETFDAWIECQRQWVHLETIFSAPDIQKQLPNEGAIFLGVNQFWKELMRRTRDQRSCMKVTGAILIGINTSSASKNPKDSGNGISGGGSGGIGVGQALLDSLTKHNSALERIEKSLEDYLEMKRRAFPRFYFISNDELLEMLAHAKEPQVVQRHLPKCFDALVKLDISDDNSGTATSMTSSQDIVAMISPEGERVAFGRTLKARGNIEDWLNAVLANMKTSLHRHIKICLGDYQHSSRETWIFRHPAQAVAVVSYIIWAKECEFCFRSRSQDPVRDLSLWHQTICSQLSNLTRLVRTSLTPLQRRVVVSLVTTDVHFRDIVESLVIKRVTDENDFLWEQQLRYQWYAESDECEIQQANCRIKYGYEYMGACSRLVITPLTDRCWMTITGALELRYGAAPSGPAGTGKTETSKDLAKALGILCIVINCSSQMSCKMMGSILNGVIQAGTWVCLDEFNRIDIEVLSVVGQQMSVLRNARLMDSTDVLLDGQCVPLREHHVIITMNPGYVGRTELPDNLKVSFRPVAMMVPDYALIAEILLFAEGFQLAKPLSRKVTKLYKLCSEQLSQQAHYDFGMRAVRTVLTMAGSLKRSAAASSANAPGTTTTNGAVPDSANISDENVVLIKAMIFSKE
ncbi:Dynein heavy chain 6, axonemal [Phytophthora rubi]|uniref:Dynein heavy chain 6, axonemal n=1 Tax=Phytophthora rubi TaxID=129364 RepID=A0A6A4FKR5_9STRA|nr:Dynein heavy chain 6, axonemal [Phytophthora rubi]